MKDKYIGKWCVFSLLSLLLISRFFLDSEHSKWIQFISFISLADLYGNVYKENHKKDKFKIITGLAIVIAIILMAIAAGMILNFIVFESKGNDILTILALLISLPNDLYCNWISKYIDI